MTFIESLKRLNIYKECINNAVENGYLCSTDDSCIEEESEQRGVFKNLLPFMFFWSETEEGYDFWSEKSREIEACCLQLGYDYKTNPLANQVGGQHYISYAIQPIEFIAKNKIGFCLGNVIKYLLRHKRKNGVDDVKKAEHYYELMLLLKEEVGYVAYKDFVEFAESNKIGQYERRIISSLIYGERVQSSMIGIRKTFKELIKQYEHEAI